MSGMALRSGALYPSSTRSYSETPHLPSVLPHHLQPIPPTSRHIRIVDVSPRDGLQNEKQIVSVEAKLALIQGLKQAGVSTIECASFVSPRRIPQMADAESICKHLKSSNHNDMTMFPVLVPNAQGLQRALDCNVKYIAVFASASEGFSQKNLQCDRETALKRYENVTREALNHGCIVRGYVSCIIACPYDGPTLPEDVAETAYRLYAAGCHEISLGDTIGVGTPPTMERVILACVARGIPITALAVHCHDTYGMAVANVWKAVELGIRVVDASVAGLGGCPFAKGTTGNVATEEVVYLLHESGYETGIQLERLMEVGVTISQTLGRPTLSKVARALLAKRDKSLL